MPKTITGVFVYANNGLPVVNGVLLMSLTAPAVYTLGSQQVVTQEIAFTLDVNGIMNGIVFANDELSPNNTTYRVWLKDAGNGQIFGPVVYCITGTSPISLNALIPVG